MKNRKSLDSVFVIVAMAALAAIFLSSSSFGPRLNRELHREIGRRLAKETLALLQPHGQIIVITRDTETFPQPALDLLLDSFRAEIRRAGAELKAIRPIQLDPLRPVEVPSGDFYEMLRRATAEQVIVSLLGPPVLSADQRAKLGPTKAKVLAFCAGNFADSVDLQNLFQAGLLHAAIVNRHASSEAGKGSSERKKAASEPGAFDDLYQTIQVGERRRSAENHFP